MLKYVNIEDNTFDLNLLIEDKKLLRYFKKIFGDCVTKAYVEDIKSRDKIRYEGLDKNLANIHFDANSILLCFNENDYVLLENSEWASIYKVPDKSIKENKNDN